MAGIVLAGSLACGGGDEEAASKAPAKKGKPAAAAPAPGKPKGAVLKVNGVPAATCPLPPKTDAYQTSLAARFYRSTWELLIRSGSGVCQTIFLSTGPANRPCALTLGLAASRGRRPGPGRWPPRAPFRGLYLAA